MVGRVKKHAVSFKNATQGIFYVIKSQPNFGVHILVAIIVLAGAVAAGVSFVEFVILFFAVVLVLTAEMINTAFESVTDLIIQTHHIQAKVAKDVAAGMVLVAAIGAAIIGILIFGRRLFLF